MAASSAALALDRPNLSEALVPILRNMIVDGALSPAERVNEVHLSEQLGVSRTPLREALGRLTAEGALRSVARFGFYVQPLSLEEFEQIYVIRPLLDPEALRLSGIPSREGLRRLRAINAEIGKAKDADAVIALDDAWHLELVSGCRNKVLIDLIEQFSRRTRRYEIALMREKKDVSTTTTDHVAIMKALARGDMRAACAALHRNLHSGWEPIVEWLRNREKK